MSSHVKVLRLPGSGHTISYEWEKKNVRHINMRIRSDGSIYVSAPPQVPQVQIERTLCDREDWLLDAIARLANRSATHPDLPELVRADRLPYLGASLSVAYTACSGCRGRWHLDEAAGILHVEIPNPASDSWRLGALQSFEKERTRELVQEYLHQYVPLLAGRSVPPPNAVRYKFMKSRWGSCASATHALNFNARLCEMPRAFIEYVVVHELCHFLHPDHSAAFWQEVGHYIPDWKARRALARE